MGLRPATGPPRPGQGHSRAAGALDPAAYADSASYPLAGIDIARELNALVAYTDKEATTSTNPWGCEVTVTGGKVIQINDRQIGESATGTPIPTGSFVLSGHGEARTWLLANAKVGAAVERITMTLRPGLPACS